MKKAIIYMAATLLCLASCKTQGVLSLDNQSFKITELNGRPLNSSEEIKPAISFADNRVNATVGCNRIFANYTAGTDGSIKFNQGGSTRMMCPEALREDEFLAAFNNVAHYKYNGKEVRFYNAKKQLLFKAHK